MRLVTFTRSREAQNSIARIGALLDDGKNVLDLFDVLGVPEKEYRSPFSLLEWFDLDGELFQQADRIVKEGLSSDDARQELARFAVPVADVHLTAPVPRPGKLICIGLNYRDHAIESNMQVPERPIVFSKFPTSIIGPRQSVCLPGTSKNADYEAELAVVIGRVAKNVAEAEAFDHVFGYTNLNDISERGFQFADGQWQRGKSCDTFAPMGPYVATKDEIADPHSLSIRFRLNGKTLQDSNTDQLIFDIPVIIAYLSETITLEPGDVIATGTPAGVGFARNPPIFLNDSDLMEVEIDGLGILRNVVTRSADY